MPFKIKTVTKEVIEIEGFTCDRCKAFFSENSFEYEDNLAITFYAGYESPWGDGTKVSAVICPQCVFELFSSFAITES